MFLKVIDLPDQDDAAGNVAVQVDPDLLLINHVSPAATVKLAVLVIGAPDKALACLFIQ